MSNTIPVRNLAAGADANGKIHTRKFQGVFRRLRIIGGSLLFTLFFGTAWLSWGDRQAVLWDLSDKKFHVFGSTFWPQDLVLLSAILMICAFGLFFITVVAGRVWCGYTCPQSVWMWVFMWAERVAEGDRNQRKKLDQASFSVSKLYKRVVKHGLWLAISLATALTFVGYFTPIRELLPDLVTLQASGMTAFWVFFFTAATYLNAGWLREKVCVHMCPYGRFQSSMLDKDSLVISYDAARGESRGARKAGSDYQSEGLGDCIDCQMCVQVCPTGIDIRDGLQMECIGCAACIDACDSIMDKMGYPKGLIRYTSERELEGGPLRIIRPRFLGYGAFLVACIATLFWAIMARPMVEFDVVKDRGLFRFNAQGNVENSYTLKVLNKSQESKAFQLSVSGMNDLSLIGHTYITVGAGERFEMPVSVAAEPAGLDGGVADIAFHLNSANEGGESLVTSSRFTGQPN
ncbi:cytochrome c oxidase accessory protein CcoG [Marinobacter salinexigens]|uniref:Cytochrome c oxidase accessory protein CcoG n=1 Tax=Marinobacter salinexigens TaxID=2919747 RepID=A0A5B0V8W1_9GAMM|nr:cytochrome c oxidase accessory protein CcoG [Marinobacter salinexigens]KAA1170987.1 cytochrome c oxidase accessory protein CcoG [Marinobacter salinexigens]